MTSESQISTPVYVPYATLISSLENLKTHGIPGTGIIDKSIWDTQSGAIQGQLLIAYRFLGLIDEKNRVLPTLPTIVKASAEERKVLLRTIIEDKYKKVVALDLKTVTQGQLEEAFRSFNVTGSTLVRAIRFFVKSCQECGIPISARVADKMRGPASAATPRKRKPAGTGKRDEENGNLMREEPRGPRVIEDKLLDKFPAFDPSWPDAIKTKWFEGFERLMKSSLGDSSKKENTKSA